MSNDQPTLGSYINISCLIVEKSQDNKNLGGFCEICWKKLLCLVISFCIYNYIIVVISLTRIPGNNID